MSIFRKASKLQSLVGIGHRNQGLSSLLCHSPRRFSTEAEQPSHNTSSDSFHQTPKTDLFYGKLLGFTNYTTKSDVVNLLEGCEVGFDDIRVEYNKIYAPIGMMIQFSSRSAYDAGIRSIVRKGRLFKLDRADRSWWDLIIPYDGKAVLLQGIPRNALLDDIERFLSGCMYDASTIQIFVRPGFPDPVRMALVHFPSKTQAIHAFITKNRSYCLNNQILMRVLQ